MGRKPNAGKHPMPWESAYYNEALDPRYTHGMAVSHRIAGLESVLKPGLPQRTDAPVKSRQDALRPSRRVFNGRPRINR